MERMTLSMTVNEKALKSCQMKKGNIVLVWMKKPKSCQMKKFIPVIFFTQTSLHVQK